MRRAAEEPLSAMTKKIVVDNRFSLRQYYRIADNLLRQANIYREEKDIVKLYITLFRYVSLFSETIPYHRDYQAMVNPKERASFKKKLLTVLDELESLKPRAEQQWEAIRRGETTDEACVYDGDRKTPYMSTSLVENPAANHGLSLGYTSQRLPQASTGIQPSRNPYEYNSVTPSNSIDMQFQKMALNLPLPKQETLSRHSLLGPNGLRGQWLGPTSEMKVNYPTNPESVSNEISSFNPGSTSQHNNLELENSAMASVLSLDDGRWPSIDQDLACRLDDDVRDDFSLIKQPSPPPVLAQVQPEYLPLSPSKVADPRPGPGKSFPDSTASPSSYQNLHIPVKMMADFLKLAKKNTDRNLETCAVLAGSLKNRAFYITTLIVPKQESTSDSCQTLNEEEIFEYQDKNSLFPLGWIHTHPTQTCFMSSVDLHTHYSYQVMLPEAIAIVMAPTDTSSPHGIFHLSDPSGVSVIRNCQQRGFHPHEEPEDGSPIYEHCSHVYMNSNLKFEVVDLR
ncbi:OLC1v1020660C3 [Oldenlandia corymbosa var. corymbosa]|uniref:OLC1v1020660C3 n=1 Tax=Oldenlandia corymbosa var. corymbosa TaxID=529605 RepID=A0AAV1EHF1_OLDCO|nr:OLC1v1020660C3 [Oldenlandia corymbosa var. corymbosa]